MGKESNDIAKPWAANPAKRDRRGNVFYINFKNLYRQLKLGTIDEEITTPDALKGSACVSSADISENPIDNKDIKSVSKDQDYDAINTTVCEGCVSLGK
jgi:hypothetical protein